MPKVSSSPLPYSTGTSTASEPGRHANPFSPVDPNVYNDYDEAMQDGVELEEKGERFQFGPKAQRFYVQAGTLYARAAHLAGAKIERRADALYNASRIYFLLASQFALPPENLETFVQAVTTAQQALRLAPPLPSVGSTQTTLPNPFTLDIMTHLATCLQTLAEAVDELGWPHGLQPPVLISQGTNEQSSPMLLWNEALTIFQQVANGQDTILQDQHVHDISDEQPADTYGEPSTSSKLDEEELQDTGDGQDVYGYTSSLVTPPSLMETYLSMLACLTSLIEAASTMEDIQTLSAAVDRTACKAEVLASDSHSVAKLPATKNDAARASSEVAARWGEVQRSALTARVQCVARMIMLSPEPSQVSSQVETLMQTINDWAAQLISTPTATEAMPGRRDAKVAELCDVGEAGQNMCRASLRLMPSEAGIAAIWSLATSSTKLFLQALAALDTGAPGGGSAAVLGQANTSTPTSRARCRILLALSSMSIFRSHPGFEAAGIAGAKGTRTKLIDNARLYARKAVTEIGLGWLLQPSPAQTPRAAVIPPPGGWESLSLESEATFHLLRAMLFRTNVNAAVDSKAAKQDQAEMHNLIQHILQLRHRPIQVGATPTATSIQLADWLYSQSAKSFVDDIVDDNGRNVVQDEITWWERLFSDQLAH